MALRALLLFLCLFPSVAQAGPAAESSDAAGSPVPIPAEPPSAEAETPAETQAPPDAEPQPDAKPRPDADADAEAQPKAEAEPQPEGHGEPRAEATAGAKAEAQPTATAQPEAELAAKAEPQAKAQAAAEEVSPWVPPWEPELMDGHQVTENIRFRPGKGLDFESKNEKFSLQIRARVQFLYELEHDNDSGDIEHLFSIRRARLQFTGNAFGQHNKFKAEFAFSPRDLGFSNGHPTNTPVLSWYAEFDYLRDLTLRLGQYKIPFSRQRVVSSGDLQFVDRALANGEFNLDRDIGFDLRSQDLAGLGYLRYYAGIYLGEGRDVYQATDFALHYLGRVEVLPFGGADDKWDYSEADFDRLRRPRLSLGAAYSFIDDAQHDRGILGNEPLDGGTTDYHSVNADFVFEVAGFSATGEFLYRNGTRTYGDATIIDDSGVEIPAPEVPARDGLGYFVQAGYLIPRLPLEFAARWSQIFGLGDGTQTSLGDGDEVGAAVSWYFAQHPLKIQADYFRLRQDTYDPETLSFNREPWSDGIDHVRVQLQVAF